jgi:calcium-dependent protein kinase
MHLNKVCHRDIKPENILFESKSEGSILKLIDFGISTHDESVMTKVIGTPYYMAPEVIQGRYTSRCDVWACGVILYMMFCGVLPFLGAS